MPKRHSQKKQRNLDRQADPSPVHSRNRSSARVDQRLTSQDLRLNGTIYHMNKQAQYAVHRRGCTFLMKVMKNEHMPRHYSYRSAPPTPHGDDMIQEISQ